MQKSREKGLRDMFREEFEAQAAFRGVYAADLWREDSAEIAWMFAVWHGLRRIKIRRVSVDVLQSWLADNVPLIESLGLRERVWRTFEGAGLVLEVRELGAGLDSTPAYYVALEASYTVEKEDTLKSADHAGIVRAVTGVQTYAVVAGVALGDGIDVETLGRVHTDLERFVEAGDPEAVFWHRVGGRSWAQR